jgi:hypothetical protein
MWAALILALAVGQKFYADDPILRDNDTKVEVTEVEKHKLNDQYDFYKHSFGKAGERSKAPAANANTMGEVPASSWFESRHGKSPMSPEQLAHGPDTTNGPSMEQPWVITDVKTEGVTPGFRIRDGRGDSYFVKFDTLGYPEIATGAEVIATKFFYAIGYNVPENHIAYFTRDQLRIDSKLNLSERELDQLLKRVDRGSDGRYRVVASKLLKGKPAGPFQYYGTRPDDPNDIFAHENRRELRGLRVFAAWLNHDDSRAINTLDMVVNDGGRNYLKHYLIDFGSTLGSGSTGPQKPRASWEYLWEPKPVFARIATFGLWDRPWVRIKYPNYPTIGNFEARYFDPETWKPEYPNPAFLNMTDQDAYWAAKIVMSFSEEDIRTIVKTGKLTDPDAENYLIDVLAARRDKIGRTWLTRVSSFDNFKWTDSGELTFDHLGSSYDFTRRPQSQISWFSFDNGNGGRHAIDLSQATERDGYVVAVISSNEGRVQVYSRIKNGVPQIVGVERQ